MKRIGNLIEKIINIDNLYLAFFKASKGKFYNSEVQNYYYSLKYNMEKLQNEITSTNVNVGNYTYFTIKDPKVRIICAASFEERVLHHALMNICHEYFDKNLIYDTYATRIDKGTYAAIDKAKLGIKNYQYVAKMDFRKYFDSISHSLLKIKLEKIFKDQKLLSIFYKIIDSYSTKENFGIPIGNLTSQYFANFFLSEIDHYAKEVMNIPIYVRYMDDILIFENDKEKIKSDIEILKEISSNPISSSLQLKPVILNPCKLGISFLGYKIFPHKILLNKTSKNRFVKKNKLYDFYLLNDVWNQQEYQNHINPLISFTQKAYTKRFRKQIIKKYEKNTNFYYNN